MSIHAPIVGGKGLSEGLSGFSGQRGILNKTSGNLKFTPHLSAQTIFKPLLKSLRMNDWVWVNGNAYQDIKNAATGVICGFGFDAINTHTMDAK